MPNKQTEWVPCPICGQPDMEKISEGEGHLIYCSNLNCASNGGFNMDGLAKIIGTEYRLVSSLQHDEKELIQMVKQLCEDAKLQLPVPWLHHGLCEIHKLRPDHPVWLLFDFYQKRQKSTA